MHCRNFTLEFDQCIVCQSVTELFCIYREGWSFVLSISTDNAGSSDRNENSQNSNLKQEKNLKPPKIDENNANTCTGEGDLTSQKSPRPNSVDGEMCLTHSPSKDKQTKMNGNNQIKGSMYNDMSKGY